MHLAMWPSSERALCTVVHGQWVMHETRLWTVRNLFAGRNSVTEIKSNIAPINFTVLVGDKTDFSLFMQMPRTIALSTT